jgi:hypothetical protein
VKAVQLLARHPSPTETVGIDTRLDAGEERGALALMPSLVTPTMQTAAPHATRTDGGGVMASGSAECTANQPDATRGGATRNPALGVAKAISCGEAGEDDGTRTRNHRRDRPVL